MRYVPVIPALVSCGISRSTLFPRSTSRYSRTFASVIPHSCMARRITSAHGTAAPARASGSPPPPLAALAAAVPASRRAPGKLDNDVCARMGLDEMGLPCQRFLRHDRQRGLGLLEAGHLLLALGFEGGNLSEYVKRYRATLPIVRNRDLLLVAHPFGLLGLLGAGLPRRGLFEET